MKRWLLVVLLTSIRFDSRSLYEEKALAMVSSTGKNPNVQIHTPSRHHTSDRLLPTRIILPLASRISIRPVHHRPFHHPRRPPHTAHEMPVRVIDRLHALAFLRQIPASYRFIVADADEVLPTGMEDKRPDPVVVPDERFNKSAPRVPHFDALVTGAGGKVFARAAGQWRLLQPRQGREVGVAGGGGEDAAFDDVLVAEERGFGFAGAGIPETRSLVVTGGE